jgi:hypothetical protein
MPRPTTPWHRWRFNPGAALVTALVGWMTWQFIGEPDVTCSVRLAGAIVWGALTLLCIWTLWVNRLPLTFGINASDDESRGAECD